MDHLKSSLPGSRAVKIRHKVRRDRSHQIKTWSISEKVEEYIRVMVFLSLSPLKDVSNFSFFFFFISVSRGENFRLLLSLPRRYDKIVGRCYTQEHRVEHRSTNHDKNYFRDAITWECQPVIAIRAINEFPP